MAWPAAASYEAVLKNADAALYQAKARGRGIACLHNHETAPALRTGETQSAF